MKKLVFLAVAFAAISFASCGNKANNAEEANQDSVQVEETTPAEEVAPEATEATDSTAVETPAETSTETPAEAPAN